MVLGAAILVVDTADALLDELVSLDVVEDGALALFAPDLGRGRQDAAIMRRIQVAR